MSSESIVANVGALIGFAACTLLLILIWRSRRRLIKALLLIPAVALGIAGMLSFWYAHRPLPTATREPLFPGVEYLRDVRSDPRPLVIHIVNVDLSTPGLRFLVTPGTVGEDLPARTVSQFLDEFDLQIAINGGFFDPWRDNGPWDYYPHEGDPVSPLAGTYASAGTVYFQDGRTDDTVYISADNHFSFGVPNGEIYNAITGYQFLLVDGVNIVEAIALPDTELHPRTAIGVDVSGQTLIIVVVDGRQPNYSEGVTLGELAGLMREFGAQHALNMDGGGSSTLVIAGADGQPRVLNSPIHTRIPGRERPVATHLGIRIAGVE